MLKVKDGYAKVIGTTYLGSSSYLLLSNGGLKAVSDFATAGSSYTKAESDDRYVRRWLGVYGSANKFLKLTISDEKGWIRLEVSDSNNGLTGGYGIYIVGWSYHGNNATDTLTVNCLYTNTTKYITALKIVRTSRNNYEFYFLFASGSSSPAYTINYSNSVGSIDYTTTAVTTIPTATWTSSLAALQLNASNADTLDGTHLNGIFTALSNTNNGISMTIGTVTKALSNMQVYSATKLVTARNIALGHDFRGSANFDGTGNITINGHINAATISLGSSDPSPFKRIAHIQVSNSYNDNALLLYLSQGYVGGCVGICRVEFRTNNVSEAGSASASVKWLVRSGYATDSVQVGYYSAKLNSYMDVFVKTTGGYQGTVIRCLQDSRGGINSNVSLLNANATTEAYTTIEAAATALYKLAYTAIVKGSDVGTVSYAINADTLDGIHANGLFTSLANSGNNISATIGGVNKTLTVAYATNCDTVDNLHAADFVRAYTTSNDNIDSDWGQSFKTFDPIPSGTPPEQNPNISLLSIGNTFGRRKQLAFTWNNDNIYYRRHIDSKFTDWIKLLHSGNSYVTDGKGVINGTTITKVDTATNADTVDSYHAQIGSNKPYGTIPAISNSGVIELGRYIDFHHDNTTGSDYSVRMQSNGNNSNVVTLPTASGTLALLTDTVSYASKLNPGRKLWGNFFDGSKDINGLITLGSGNHMGIKIANTYLDAIDQALIIHNNSGGIRFGNDDWDWNQWAGLKYNHSSKTIYLGIADGSVFTANNALNGGGIINLKAGISTIEAPNIKFGNVTSGLCQGLEWTCGDNDFARIKAGATASNAGYLEIATADDGNEPIYVRLYTGTFANVKRTLTLLDSSGRSIFPYYVSIGGDEGNNSSPNRVWGSNGSDTFLRSYLTSALSVNYANSAGNADKLDGVHLNGIFTAFGNNAHNITATIGGVTKEFVVNWSADSDKLDGKHASDFALASHSHSYLPLAGGTMNNSALIKRTASSVFWYLGRDVAMIRETSSTGYHSLWSLKTANGSWEFGEFNNTDWFNIPVLTYITDANYNTKTNAITYLLKFLLKSGTIALTSDLPSVGNGTITINLGSTKKGSFTVNLSGNTTITVDANTWRPITDNYSGTNTLTSLSLKGANDLYNTLNPTGYYWANVKVSATSSTATSPTVNVLTATRVTATRICAGYDSGVDYSISCSGWFRSSGSTGWYNGTYLGGWYMSDTSWVRSHANKGIYTGGIVRAASLEVFNSNKSVLVASVDSSNNLIIGYNTTYSTPYNTTYLRGNSVNFLVKTSSSNNYTAFLILASLSLSNNYFDMKAGAIVSGGNFTVRNNSSLCTNITSFSETVSSFPRMYVGNNTNYALSITQHSDFSQSFTKNFYFSSSGTFGSHQSDMVDTGLSSIDVADVTVATSKSGYGMNYAYQNSRIYVVLVSNSAVTGGSWVNNVPFIVRVKYFNHGYFSNLAKHTCLNVTPNDVNIQTASGLKTYLGNGVYSNFYLYLYYGDRFFKLPIILGGVHFTYLRPGASGKLGSDIFTSFTKKSTGHYIITTNLQNSKFPSGGLIVQITASGVYSDNVGVVDARGVAIANADSGYIDIEVYSSDDTSLNDTNFDLLLLAF